MNINYDRISESYDRHRRGNGPFVSVLARLAQECSAHRVLELGPGTGNVTAAFLETHPAWLVGIEPSAGMLAKATAKGLPAAWARGTATAIPLAGASVDFLFACYVLHHIRDLAPAMRECARVLRPGGRAAFVTSSHDYIRRHPMNRYFPSFAAIDLQRFHSDDAIKTALETAGFDEIGAEHVSEPRPIDRAYADRVAGRFISTYDLIPEQEFQEGLRRLYADLEATGRLDEDTGWEALIIWGHRPPNRET